MQKVKSSPRLKFSVHLSPEPRKVKLSRPSQTIIIQQSATNFFEKDPSSLSQSLIDSQCSKTNGRFSYKDSKKKNSTEDQDKKGAVQNLMNHLKINYPRQEKKEKINRVKSEVLIEKLKVSTKTEKFKAEIADIQKKLVKYKIGNSKEKQSKNSPQKKCISPRVSPQKIGQTAQKCKELCLNLKKKVLKETVSTTMTEHQEFELNISQFSLGKLLGKGKFSKVYLAKHNRSGLLVALKIIKKQTIRKQKFSNQLARQIVVQSFFNHVNLVQLYGMFADETNVYLILEYCMNGQLYDIFKIKSKLKDQEWAPIMKGICQGLFSLHLHDVIHRDLKPENILLAFGLPKIGDFGWTVYSPGNRRQTFCGTPLYISPELLMGNSYDKQVDIWALGVMMFEFITGKIPFKLKNNINLVEAVNEEIDFPENLSQKSSNLLKMILKKDPQTRIAILDILEHPYLKNCFVGKGKFNSFNRLGR